MTDIYDAIAGLNRILAAGRIDVIYARDGFTGRNVGVVVIAHEQRDDGTDAELAVVHAPDYEQAQIAMYETLVEAGHEVSVP